jgi:hypothetical protein
VEPVAAAVARIWLGGKRVVGAGFLVGPHEVLTCSHVIMRNVEPVTGSPTGDSLICVDFPLVAPGSTVRARLVLNGAKRKGSEEGGWPDISLLRLDSDAPPGVIPTRLVTVPDLWGSSVPDFRVPGGPRRWRLGDG